MTPHEFLAKWRHVDLKERTASQSHFNDLCRLIGVDDPISADPKGEWFTFEKGATKTSGGEGWADVWRKGCFAWEYKGRQANLERAFDQLLRYSIALETPPLLIVSDMERIRIHTNWTNTVQRVHEIALEELADASRRDLLRQCFTDPEALRPTKTRQMLTEEAAREFAGLAQRLRDRGHDAQEVAHFVNRLVFCMFAEDVGLLPDNMFSQMLKAGATRPESFAEHARTLFGAMQKGGLVGFTKVDWFNGGLFDDDSAFALERPDIDALIAAAALDWSEIDPSILGTLFERGLDPDKRSQLGAHYTDRDKIMLIVRPVIIEPLEREWSTAKATIEAALAKAEASKAATRSKAQAEAARVMAEWRERLLNFRVLDPACGSGNFLYLSLLALKDIEHRTNLEAEAMGLPREFPRVGPECVLGIELNPYAAELARVSVWIGEIQWMRRNGFDAARNPVLRPLATIECRDAVVGKNGSPAEWPSADVIVGNPPFLGNKKMSGALGVDYATSLRRAWPEVPGGADLVAYWFAGAWKMMATGKVNRAGLVATNSIRGGASREVLEPIVSDGCIFNAWTDESWVIDGAAVRVSIVCFSAHAEETSKLNGVEVRRVGSDLGERGDGAEVSAAQRLPSNAGISFQGVSKVGPFEMPGVDARALLAQPANPNGLRNSHVLRPWITGTDLAKRPEDTWVVDFGTKIGISEAALFEGPFARVQELVAPLRQGSNRAAYKERWWIHGEARPGMRDAISKLARYIATPKVSRHRFFVFRDKAVLPSNLVIAIARDDPTTLGVLSSRLHEVWSLKLGQWIGVGNDPTYTPTSTFETFPFPAGLTLDIPAAAYADDARAQAIAAAAARLNELRENWLNPADLIRREPEVVPGYPDRLLPINDAAAKELAKRTLTNLYNTRPAWLEHAHRDLDQAVADAYGWGDDFRAGTLSDDEILARLFRLNQERSGIEA